MCGGLPGQPWPTAARKPRATPPAPRSQVGSGDGGEGHEVGCRGGGKGRKGKIRLENKAWLEGERERKR